MALPHHAHAILPDGAIDVSRLEMFLHNAYHQAGFERQDIDCGAAIGASQFTVQVSARPSILQNELCSRCPCARGARDLDLLGDVDLIKELELPGS